MEATRVYTADLSSRPKAEVHQFEPGGIITIRTHSGTIEVAMLSSQLIQLAHDILAAADEALADL